MSSWRETAKRVLQQDTDAADEARDEREAIAHFDGGLPQSWAAALAAIAHGPRPDGISERDWRAFVDIAWRRADAHGAELAANGWTFAEVFGVGEHWARLDQRGAAWLVAGARIVAIDPERIVFERGADRLTHRKPELAH